jgi:hypothetical protein
LRALDPVPVTELGKADTRSVTGTGSCALTAPQAGTSQACEPVPFPERVSAFPSSGNGTGSDAPATDCPLAHSFPTPVARPLRRPVRACPDARPGVVW